MTEEEKRDIEESIEVDIFGAGFTHIPWESDTDGGPADMLRLLKMVRTAFERGFGIENYQVPVFIDRHSAVDRKAIVCYSKYVYSHTTKGSTKCTVLFHIMASPTY